MASTKEYRDYVLKKLANVPDATCQPMMGEFLLYSAGALFGGIYDDCLLVKIAPTNAEFGMREELPYDGAKPMYLAEDVDDKETLRGIVEGTVKSMI